ncbi:BRO family protein [Escherichia coli]
MSTQLIFKSHVLETIELNGKQWFTAATLATALEYSRTDSVARIYDRNRDEFSAEMTTTANLTVVRKTGSIQMNNRLFSLRGAHLVAMFATTPVAKEFRRWVLDILDRETEKTPQPHIQPQFTAEEIILLCYMLVWMEKAQDISKHLYPIMKELNSSYTNKLYDIAFETIYMVTKNRDALLREAARLDQSTFVVKRAMPMLKRLRARQFEF